MVKDDLGGKDAATSSRFFKNRLSYEELTFKIPKNPRKNPRKNQETEMISYSRRVLPVSRSMKSPQHFPIKAFPSGLSAVMT